MSVLALHRFYFIGVVLLQLQCMTDLSEKDIKKECICVRYVSDEEALGWTLNELWFSDAAATITLVFKISNSKNVPPEKKIIQRHSIQNP